MIDIEVLKNMVTLSSLLVGALLGGFIYFFIQKIFLMGLKSNIEKSAKKFEDALEQSQISAFLKLKEIQKQHLEAFEEIYECISENDSHLLHLNKNIDNFRATLHNLNIEIKNNSNTKKELEFEIVKLKNIINRIQKKDKNHESKI
ncbi:IncA protein [Aliarcobacter thereius]|nr:IncA protein [Aliarcobacter thereius]